MTRSHKSSRKSTASFGSRTDVGCIREHNEDSLAVAPPLYVVADGMGGHAAGEVASEIAVQVISEQAPSHPDADELGKAVKAANRAILRAAQEGQGREGMGTTCTAAMLEGERLVIAQVGDSRAYLLHKGKLQQLTRDHSLMADLIEAGRITPEEARYHPDRSKITRALGSDPHMQPDLYEINVETGDRLMLCSDGLSGMLEDAQMESILRRTDNPQRCAAILVNEAIAAGGHDNVTVIVADVEGFAEKRTKKIARKSKLTFALILVLILAVLGGTAYGFNAYMHTAAYLAEDNGYVAVYTGRPGTILGVSFSELKETTDVSLADLQPNTAERLQKDGIIVDNEKAAYDLVDQYRKQIEDDRKAAEAESAKNDAAAKQEAAKQEAQAAQTEAAETVSTESAIAPTGDAA